LFLTLVLYVAPGASIVAAQEGKWVGIDEKVVEKIATEHGRPPRESLINTDQGDLLLFVFLGAGTLGGFAAGYYWHKLITSPPSAAQSFAERRD